MTFHQQVADAVAAIYAGDGPAESIVWAPAGGVERRVSAIIVRGDDLAAIDPGQADMAKISIPAASIDTPRPHDKIYDEAGNEWEVLPGATLNAAQWVIPVIKNQRIRGA